MGKKLECEENTANEQPGILFQLVIVQTDYRNIAISFQWKTANKTFITENYTERNINHIRWKIILLLSNVFF